MLKKIEMTTITVAKGDGIGPEIMDATLKILHAAGAQINVEEIEVGEKVYLSGNTSGIAQESWDIIRKKQDFFEGSNYHSSRWRVQKFKRNYPQIFGFILQCKTV